MLIIISTYYVPVTIPSAFYVFAHLNLTIILAGEYYHKHKHPRVTCKETGA